MSNIGFFLDVTRCTGCRTCQVACKDKNRIMEPGALFRRVESWETGTFPNGHVYHVSTSCNHCTDAACVANCPTGAMFKAEDGAVLHNDEACIGCGTCVSSCPYEVPVLFQEDNIVHKCDTCRVLRDAGGNPACVDSCMMRALDFGTEEELKARHGDDIVRGIPAYEDRGTQPNVFFKVGDRQLEPSPRAILI